MPENQPPENDPFADLYGRLPDPRRAARSSSGDDAAPPSRRAAREARRTSTGPTPTPESSDAPTPDAAPRFDAARRAPEDTPAAPPVETARPAAQDTPAPAPAPRAADDGPTVVSTAVPAAEVPDAAPRRTASAPALRGDDLAQPGPVRRGTDGPALSSDAARRAAAAAPAPAAPSGPSAAASPPVEPARDEVREPVLVGAGAAAAGSAASGSRSAAAGSLEDLFTGQTTTHDIGEHAPRAAKKRRRIAGWIALAIVVLIVGGVAAGGLYVWNTYGDRVREFLGTSEPIEYAAGEATGEARVTIVAGDTGESVSPKLFDAGVTKASNSLYKYMVDNAVGFTFQPGVYKLQQKMTSEAVIAALKDPATRLNYSVQLREGLTLNQSLDLIAEQLKIPRADLDAATADPSQYGVPASTLEGWIFPATYDFDEGVTAQQVVQTMVQRTVQSLDKAGVPEGDRERILIIASIIEREARSSEDFYKVSRVIENRLQPDNTETHGLLQMDSTAQYGANELDAGSSSSSENALTSDNPWNTYIRPGLPVGPIANAGDLAIDAAMHPVDGTWYYFTTVNLATGETVFSTTYADQLKAVDQFQAWCRENPDGGC